jgi:hypothetical protein
MVCFWYIIVNALYIGDNKANNNNNNPILKRGEAVRETRGNREAGTGIDSYGLK